jgi:cell pole-organizing protein PopZ
MMAASPVLVPVPRPGQSDPTIQLTPPLPSEPVVSTELPRPDAAPVNPPEPLAPIPQPESSPMSASLSSPSGLASSETATAAAGSVTNLVRALTSDRNAQVHSGGPTIADLVREEMRPMLKDWLDSNLPPLVERLVRAEIERVISRAAI